MSGFLDQLIARGLGLEEVIRPRARLLFEPQPADIAPLEPAAFGKSEFEEVATLPEAPMRPPGRQTIERNYRESVGADGDTAATRLRPSALVEPRDIASGIRSGQVKVEDAPRLFPAANAENRAARAAFNEGVPLIKWKLIHPPYRRLHLGKMPALPWSCAAVRPKPLKSPLSTFAQHTGLPIRLARRRHGMSLRPSLPWFRRVLRLKQPDQGSRLPWFCPVPRLTQRDQGNNRELPLPWIKDDR
jgi:hypothetical protein